MLYSNKYFFDQYHQYYHSQYQSGYHSVRILDTTRSRTQGLSRIPQSISLSIRIQLSLYSQVSVLRNKIQLNLIPNLYLSFKKVIQDASCLLTKQQLLSKQSIIPTDVYFEFYDRGEHNYKFYVVIYNRKQINRHTSFAQLFTSAFRFPDNVQRNLSRCVQLQKYRICSGIYYILTIMNVN